MYAHLRDNLLTQTPAGKESTLICHCTELMTVFGANTHFIMCTHYNTTEEIESKRLLNNAKAKKHNEHADNCSKKRSINRYMKIWQKENMKPFLCDSLDIKDFTDSNVWFTNIEDNKEDRLFDNLRRDMEAWWLIHNSDNELEDKTFQCCVVSACRYLSIIGHDEQIVVSNKP